MQNAWIVGSSMPSTRAARCAHVGEHGVDFGERARAAVMRRAPRIGELAFDHRGRLAARQVRGEQQARRGTEQRHHVAELQRRLRRMARFHPVHDGRALVAPYGDADRLVDAVAQLGERDARELHAVDRASRASPICSAKPPSS
jgi:hypothetical protein